MTKGLKGRPAARAEARRAELVPTAPQLAYLDALARLSTELGRAPTLSELSGYLGYDLVNGAQEVERRCLQKGLVETTLPKAKKNVPGKPKQRRITALRRRWLRAYTATE
mgnify:FL=1